MLGSNVPAAEPLNFCHAESCLCATKFQVRTAKVVIQTLKSMNLSPLEYCSEFSSIKTCWRTCSSQELPPALFHQRSAPQEVAPQGLVHHI